MVARRSGFPGQKGRLMAIGYLGDRPMTVVFRFLGEEAVSIISTRIASEKERRLIE